MLRPKLTLTKICVALGIFLFVPLVKLFLSFPAYYFQMQRLQRELGNVSDGPHRLAAPDWLSLPALPPVVLHSPMSW